MLSSKHKQNQKTAAEPESKEQRQRGRPSAEVGEQRLRSLHRIAMIHFIERGLEGVNLTAIAKEAGVTRQMINARYGTKENFFKAIFENADMRLFPGIMPAADADPLAASWVLKNLGEKMLKRLSEPEVRKGIMGIYVVFHNNQVLAQQFVHAYQEIIGELAAYLARAAQAHKLKIDERAAARDFIALIGGLYNPVMLGLAPMLSPRASKQAISGIVDRYLRGLGFPSD